jgi:biotin carboxyl carrier protein
LRARANLLRFATRGRIEGRVGVRREKRDARGGFENALLVGIGVPIGRDYSATAETAGARSEAVRAAAEASRIRTRTAAERSASAARLAVLRRTQDEAQVRRDALAQALALTERGRREGEIGFIEVLRGRQALGAADRDLGRGAHCGGGGDFDLQSGFGSLAVTGRRTFTLLGALLLAAAPGPMWAHEGEDHSEEKAVATAPAATTSGRLAVQTADLEVVAAAEGHDLTIWLDQWANNFPVTNARVNVTVDGRSIEAKAVNGTYILDAPSLDAPGSHRLSFAITRGDAVRTATGTLEVAAAAEQADGANLPWRTLLLVALGLVAAVAIALLWRAKRRGPAAAVAAILAAISVVPDPISAHEGEEHEHQAPAASAAPPTGSGANADAAAARDAAGGVIALKPLQRIIALRTELAIAGQASPTIELTGRIIADPQGGGLVQSTTGGRILAAGGLPLIGQRVRAGQVLATIEPPLAAIDRADIARELADLDQQIALAANRAARVRRLEGVIPRREIEEAQIALAGLRSRRAGLGQARSARETLVAPISGIVSAVPVRVGQVVGPETTLFEIIDPSRLFVEANIFDRRTISTGSRAIGRAADGTTFDLVFAGGGLSDRGSAGQGQFRLIGSPPGLRVGEPVTLEVAAGAPVPGVVVPRAAVLTGESGLDAVFVKVAPERFVSRAVRTAPLDAGRVVLLSGVRVGERVVTAGAGLLSQVR